MDLEGLNACVNAGRPGRPRVVMVVGVAFQTGKEVVTIEHPLSFECPLVCLLGASYGLFLIPTTCMQLDPTLLFCIFSCLTNEVTSAKRR